MVTVIGCRNMWLLAQERVKGCIRELGGRLVGNIVLGDRASNLVGVATIAYWMLTGRKDRLLGVFPKPGVDAADIRGASRFGVILRKALQDDIRSLDQEVLNAVGAVRVEPAYIIFEKRIMKVFRIWARFIRQKGGPGAPARLRLLARLAHGHVDILGLVLGRDYDLGIALARLRVRQGVRRVDRLGDAVHRPEGDGKRQAAFLINSQ